MYRRCCSLLLLALPMLVLAAAGGCTTCQNCDDHCGSYYGGRTGDWVHQTGRAGSAYAPSSAEEIVVDDQGAGEATLDTYY